MTRIVIVGVALVLAGCGKKEEAKQPTRPAEPPAPPAPPVDEARPVCCESFGYGAQMVKCCESYEWTTADRCVVPTGMVGGGKQVVADDKCPAR